MSGEYLNMLRTVNREANCLIGEGFGTSVGSQLQKSGFEQEVVGTRLKYSGKKVKIIYDSNSRIRPFSIELEREDDEAKSEAKKLLNGVLEDMLTNI